MPLTNTTNNKVHFSIHAEIYKHDDLLPPPVIDFFNDGQSYSFVENLSILEDRLTSYTPGNPAKKQFKYFFQGLCQYYLQRQTYSTWLEKAVDVKLFQGLWPGLFDNILNSKRTNERILVIVSFDHETNNHFKVLSSLHEAITVIALEFDFDAETLYDSLNTFDQVFIAGHGENRSETYEGHIRLGNTLVTPGMISEAINAHRKIPTVLGIFTCGEAFYSMKSRSLFEYFIADHQSSVPRFIEMFLYGYLLTYFKYYNVLQAFQAGRLATIFMAKSDPTYQIFARGVKLQE